MKLKVAFSVVGLLLLFVLGKTFAQQASCTLRTDIDCSGKINAIDLSLLLADFGKTSSFPTGNPTTQPTTQPSVRPTTQPTSSATPTSTPGDCTYPSDILSLTNWKITLPVVVSGGNEVKQLIGYKNAPWFTVAENCQGVQFRAHNDTTAGQTTSNSSYLRSELRERESDGSKDISWSNSSGTHTLIIDQKVIKLPNVHPHFVVGQIHDGNDDVTVFRVEGSELWATDGDTTHGTLIDGDFRLNQRFQVKFVATPGKIQSFYKAPGATAFVLAQTLNKTISGAYFKAGAYVQSNCRSDREGAACALNNYGEVIIYGVTATHN